MKSQRRFLILGLCLLLLSSVLASGQTIYDNGPRGDDVDAWTINQGFVVSDTFTVSQGTSQINGVVFNGWVFPGDVLQTVEVSITSQEFGGTTYFDQQVNFTQSQCSANAYGFNTCIETSTFNGPTLGNGTYWLNLSNAVVSNGDPIYWDENSGDGCQSPGCPSQASESSVGTIPSESFTVLGSTSSGGGSVPEPGTLALVAGALCSGFGLMWRRIR